MADAAPVVHIGENSPEEVALKLLQLIARAEGRSPQPEGKNPMTRQWIISTYVQCRSAINGHWSAADILKGHPVIE